MNESLFGRIYDLMGPSDREAIVKLLDERESRGFARGVEAAAKATENLVEVFVPGHAARIRALRPEPEGNGEADEPLAFDVEKRLGQLEANQDAHRKIMDSDHKRLSALEARNVEATKSTAGYVSGVEARLKALEAAAKPVTFGPVPPRQTLPDPARAVIEAARALIITGGELDGPSVLSRRCRAIRDALSAYDAATERKESK